MSLTRTDLEDLTAGTVVEYRRDVWPAGSCIRGPLESFGSDRSLYILTGLFGVRQENGEPYEPRAEITVIAEAEAEPEPPLYVNHDRSKPFAGDVARGDGPHNPTAQTYRFDADTGQWHYTGSSSLKMFLPERLRLLVDGETGEVVR